MRVRQWCCVSGVSINEIQSAWLRGEDFWLIGSEDETEFGTQKSVSRTGGEVHQPGHAQAVWSAGEDPHRAPGDLERQIRAFVEHYNYVGYHESIDN
jgi:hypothetical protein